jgi:hypothetical protein
VAAKRPSVVSGLFFNRRGQQFWDLVLEEMGRLWIGENLDINRNYQLDVYSGNAHPL